MSGPPGVWWNALRRMVEALRATCRNLDGKRKSGLSGSFVQVCAGLESNVEQYKRAERHSDITQSRDDTPVSPPNCRAAELVYGYCKLRDAENREYRGVAFAALGSKWQDLGAVFGSQQESIDRGGYSIISHMQPSKQPSHAAQFKHRKRHKKRQADRTEATCAVWSHML